MKIKDKEKYQKIIHVAAGLIVREGLAGFSTTKVAKIVGISQSNIYIYFENKKALIQQVFYVSVQQLSVYVIEKTKGGTLIERLASNLDALLQFALVFPQTIEVIEIIKRSEMLDYHEKEAGEENEEIQMLLAEGIQQGIFRQTNINVLRFLIMGTVHDYVYALKKGIYTQKEVSKETIQEMLMAAILKK